MNSRLLAAKIINHVTNGHSLTDSFEKYLKSDWDARDRGFVQALCYSVCRFYTRLDILLSYLLKKPMNEKDSDVHALILVGLCQLTEMRIPEHAAVSETVNATEKLNKPWARGLVNAVLREYLRHRESLEKKMQTEIESVYAHPLWWIKAIKKAWPEDWEKILNANNAHPPFSLRVNIKRLSRETFLDSLKETSGFLIPETTSGITLETPVALETLPEFIRGDISVQDGAAQLAAVLMNLKPGMRVLDACAAPGGKLTHLLEIEPQLSECVAVEKDPDRMDTIQQNLARLKQHAKCLCADALDTASWWDGQLFDRILLDAPCSASGVVRRHPDIKLLREPTDIPALAHVQYQLLSAMARLLKPGGLLVYATCSIFPEENANVIHSFLSAHPAIKEEPIDATWGRACQVGRQILPGEYGMDGFYYARLRL